jgi:hypothetical protein
MVEDGLFLLDAHLRAGQGGLIDLLGVDKAGALTLLEIERCGEEELFRRALQHLQWVVAQTPFLRRLYGAERIHPFRRVRVILLARNFSEAFMAKVGEHSESMTAILFTLSSNGKEEGGEVTIADSTEESWEPLPAGEPLNNPPERLTAEELEAFYRFEQRRLEQEKEGAAR